MAHSLKHIIYLGISKLFTVNTVLFFLKTCQCITFQVTGLYSWGSHKPHCIQGATAPKTHHESCCPYQRSREQREWKGIQAMGLPLPMDHPREEVGLAINMTAACFFPPPQRAGCGMNTPPCTWPLQSILLKQVSLVWHLGEIRPSPVRRCCLESCWCVIVLPQYF